LYDTKYLSTKGKKVKKKIAISLIVVSALSFIGCDSSSDSDSETDTKVDIQVNKIEAQTETDIQTGVFVDAPVQGLEYITDTQNGYTNEKGEFQYVTGEDIEFKLGNLSLGKVTSDTIVTPYTMANTTSALANNKSTNIALILQNLDNDRSDDILNLSSFQDHQFDTIDFTQDVDTMLTKVNQLREKHSSDVASGDTLTVAEVKSSMNEYIDKAQQTDNITNIINKEYTEQLKCPPLLECTTSGLTNIKITDSDFIGTYSGKDFTRPYIVEDGLLKIIWEEDDISYMRIVDTSNNIVSYCESSDKEDAKVCKVDRYWITSENKDSFITEKSKEHNSLPSTLVTDFSEIQNKDLYQLEISGSSIYSSRINIDSNGKFSGDFTYSESNYYDATFTDGSINVVGSDNGEDYDRTHKVFKYTLAGESIDTKDFASGPIFDDDNFTEFYGTKINFTKGNMYCHILWSECWVDKDAIDQMTDTVKTEQSSRTISVANGFGEKWLDGREFYAVGDGIIQTFKFENGFQTITPASTLKFPYSVTDTGLLRVDESVGDEKTEDSENRFQDYKILAIDGDKISTCEDDDSDVSICTEHSQWLFTTKSSAQTYLDSL